MPIQPLTPEIKGQLQYMASVLTLLPGQNSRGLYLHLKKTFRSGGDTAVRAYLERYHEALKRLEPKTTPAL